MTDTMTIKKDIFVAIVSNGSTAQKENWKATAEEAFKWVASDTTTKVVPEVRLRNKK